MKQWVVNQIRALRRDWLKVLIICVGGIVVVSIGAQLLYPTDRLVPFAVIDGQTMSGWSKAEAIKQLDTGYTDQKLPIYFGSADKAYRTPSSKDLGLKVSNSERINKIDYPWYLRIVPSSVLWVHNIIDDTGAPQYQSDAVKLDAYIKAQLGESCDVLPVDASLKFDTKSGLTVVKSHMGGKCDIAIVRKILLSAKPVLGQDSKITIPVDEIAPVVSDDDAKKLGDDLTKKVGDSVDIKVNNEVIQIASKDVLGWMDFATVDGQITFTFNTDRAGAYLGEKIAPKVAIASGTTTVSTYNFTETSRVNGLTGRALSVALTLDGIKAFLEGKSTDVSAVTISVAPKVVYSRSYSSTDTGLSALMQQFAESHSGVYGVSMIELGGQNRRASYNDTRSFTTASTYKLFVAYSTLRRVESGTWSWSDQINGGRDLAKCFDDMIVKSDNACAEVLLYKIGFQTITNEAHSIGATHTSFMGSDGIKTTPADLGLVLAQLQTGQILNQQSSRDTWIGAMKRNIYRQGIPAGINATVADKVGFLDSLLHDAAIVYSPTGTYVLVIMTDGSSWGNIAELAGKIEALRNQ